MSKRVAIYTSLTASEDHSAIESQIRDLTIVGEELDWDFVAFYADQPSEAVGREERPGFDALMRAGARAEFSMVAASTVGRPGTCVSELKAMRSALKAHGVDLYLHGCEA
ncbi:hypothetical protein GCM10022280_18380 [Sphingomonas swuensis]|uniref:Resolvase/invertase-type recombinase catalytic domain-containing protein n=1 Tax=Sphingomonas swuensis TaxID=977800 RepID=A0ABP7SZV8_9SPHN